MSSKFKSIILTDNEDDFNRLIRTYALIGSTVINKRMKIADAETYLKDIETTTSETITIANYYRKFEDQRKIVNWFRNYNVASKGYKLAVIMADEILTHEDPLLYEGVYLYTGYLMSNPSPKNMAFKDALNLNADEYLTNSLYISGIFLKMLLGYVDNLYTTPVSVFIQNMTFSTLESYISDDPIYLYSNQYFMRTAFFGEVQSNGDIKFIHDFRNNFPFEPYDDFSVVTQYKCNEIGEMEEEDVYKIGLIADNSLAGEYIIPIFDSVYLSTNVNNLLNMGKKRLILIIDSNITHTPAEQYDFYVENNIMILIYYSHTNIIYKELPQLSVYHEDSDGLPVLFNIGYLSGQFCHPRVFSTSLIVPSQLQLVLEIEEDKSDVILITSDNPYIYIFILYLYLLFFFLLLLLLYFCYY